MSTDGTSRSTRLETVGNKDTMNLHNILYQNVIGSPYFKSLYEKKTYHEVIDEIYNQVSSLEPFFKGTHASTAFCLLYKLWTLKLTVKQVQGLITHTDSPHIRALGFLYLRYVCKPADLWEWYEPYLDDEEELQVEGGAKPRSMAMGRFLRELLTENKWQGTMLPRIPVPIARDLEKKLKETFPANVDASFHGDTTASAPKGGHYHDKRQRAFQHGGERDRSEVSQTGRRYGSGGSQERGPSYRESESYRRTGRRSYSPRRYEREYPDRREYRDNRDYRRRSQSPPRYDRNRSHDRRGYGERK